MDAILVTREGRWAAFEIKLATKVGQTKKGSPLACVVITANGFAFRRKGGVFVVPSNTLGK